MDRRDFLRACAALGISGLSLTPQRLFAQASSGIPRSEYLFINLFAGGGWDTTSLCDPKTGNYAGKENTPITKLYDADKIKTIATSGLQYPALHATLSDVYDANEKETISWETFFSDHAGKLRVINGINNTTINHRSGQKNAGSGLKRLRHPSLGALYAAHNVAQNGMPYLSYGGYDETRDLLSLTRPRFSSQLYRAAQPNMKNPVHQSIVTYQSASAANAVQLAVQERLERLRGTENMLPRKVRNLERLQQARLGAPDLARLQDNVLPYLKDCEPEKPSTCEDPNPITITPTHRIQEQARLAVSAYKAGLCSAANLHVGNFDTHDNHDATHLFPMAELFLGFDFLIKEAEAAGIADQLVVLISSDFGRPPFYNSRNGKDHWLTGSAMLYGKNIPGNTVFGQTNAKLEPVNTNGDPLYLMSGDPNEKPITMEALHYALRRHLGISQDLCERFSLNGPDITGHDPDELLYG